MSFRLVLKSVTLNDLERRNGLILHYFAELGSLGKSGWRYTDTLCEWYAAQTIYWRFIIYDDIRRESPQATWNEGVKVKRPPGR